MEVFKASMEHIALERFQATKVHHPWSQCCSTNVSHLMCNLRLQVREKSMSPHCTSPLREQSIHADCRSLTFSLQAKKHEDIKSAGVHQRCARGHEKTENAQKSRRLLFLIFFSNLACTFRFGGSVTLEHHSKKHVDIDGKGHNWL